MDTTDFEDVLREACGEAGEDADSLSQEEFAAWRRFANNRLDKAWRYHYWPDLGRTEQRYYRLPWVTGGIYIAATAGQDNAANEVWWALTGLYFVALTATAGAWVTGCDTTGFNALWVQRGVDANNFPIFALFVHPTNYTLSVQNGAWTILDSGNNVLYTAISAFDPTGPNATSWENAAATVIPAMLSSNGVPPTDGSGNMNLGFWAVTQQYAIQPGMTGTSYDWLTNPPYTIPVLNVPDYNPTVTYLQGQRVQFIGNVYQLFALTATGDLPTDAASWGLIPPFDAYVPYEQGGQTPFTVVEGVFSANPKITTRGNTLNSFLSDRGVQVKTPIAYAWIQFRLRCPKLNGNYFRADTAYAAGQTMYFSSALTNGNFYQALMATTAGDTPETAAAKWNVVVIPRIFHRYLVLGMAADWGKDFSGANLAARSASMAGQEMAQDELDEVKSLYVGQMGQRVKTEVRTR